MNIFFLDTDPVEAAKAHCDKHCVKMLLETAQIINTIAHKNGVQGFYKPTHASHPSVIWAGSTKQNFMWLCKMFYALCEEYTHRYNKKHLCQTKMEENNLTVSVANKLLDAKLTAPMLAVLDELKVGYKRTFEDAVQRYRAYYLTKPEWVRSYTNRHLPVWM